MATVAQKSKRERGYDSSRGYKQGLRQKMKNDGAFDGRFKHRVEERKMYKRSRQWDWRDELLMEDEYDAVEEEIGAEEVEESEG